MVKFALPEDLSQIKAIADAHRKELGFVNRTHLAAAIDKQEVLCDRDFGFLHFHNRRDRISTLHLLAICPEARRQGIGRQLLRSWEEHSRQCGMTVLR